MTTMVIVRPESVPLQMSCGWCGQRLREGPLSPEGNESTGICAPCATVHFPEPPAAAPVPLEVH